MEIIIDCIFYSYFGGMSKHKRKTYRNLLEGWNIYKRTQANDFEYEDAWQRTTFRVVREDRERRKPQRPHARTKQEWVKLQAFMEAYACTGMRAAYVEQNMEEIVTEYDLTHFPFDEDIPL